MSKVLDSVEFYQTGLRYAKYQPLDVVDIKEDYRDRMLSADHLYEYDVHVTIHCRVRSPSNGFHEMGVKERAREYLSHHIFGEFHEHLAEIRLALHNCENDKAQKWLDKMETQMFSTRIKP